jgi:hypothetical protein
MNKDLSRPEVTVHIPNVKLQLKDLAYLRSLSQTDSTHFCALDSKSRDKLRFLDLIAQAKVAPSEATVADVAKEKALCLKQLHASLESESWEAVNSASYMLQRLARRLEPTVQDVLTEKGKSLLQNGEVSVKVRKVGCV